MEMIPRITPVRDKSAWICQDLIYPGSMSRSFPAGVGPRAVYLDPRYDYPEQPLGSTPDQERERQEHIWQPIYRDGGGRFLDEHARQEADPSAFQAIRERAFEAIGHRNSAEFFEQVYSELLGQTMNVVLISTGVTTFTGDFYHDIGYLAAESS